MSITRYHVEYGSMTGHNMGRYTDWDRYDSFGDTFDGYQQAFDYFTECKARLRNDFSTEWSCSPSPHRVMMGNRGFYTQIIRYEFDSVADFDWDNWSDCQIVDYAEYTYEDWQKEDE